jgi:UTP--glucose-1-phosphate uridylyltransferase
MSDTFSWYPPGHGNFYQAFVDSGLLDKLEAIGRKYVFLSNIDNMSGTASLNILNKIVKENREFVLEVTNKTRADVKGSTLIHYDGSYRLLEMQKVPKEKKWIETINQMSMFNTNNVWISMSGEQFHLFIIHFGHIQS